MKINPFIFRNYDIRGKAGEDLDADKVEALGKAYGTFLRKRKIRQAVVGRDCRLTGEEYQQALMRGMLAMGIDIIDLGQIMTQMMYFSQYRFQTNGGVMVTASHNPSNFNGFKIGIGYSKTTEEEEVQELLRLIQTEEWFESDYEGSVVQEDVSEDYYHDVLKRVRLKKTFKVVFDPRHGTSGPFMMEILKRAGIEVIGKNLEVDGSFPEGTPDPTDAHVMGQLREAVLAEKADIGFAMDGDGDRVGVVDGDGNILWNDVLVAIFAKEILERFPGSKIIYNTLCSQVVPAVVEECGGIPIIWKTGHAFIKSKISEVGAAFGGELSGHFFFNDNAYGHDDGSYAILRILEYLSEKNVGLSELYASFPKFISSPEIKIGCADDKKIGVVEDLSKKFKADFPAAKITDSSVIPGDDGVRADFDNGMVVFRYSQNGPYITVRFEATDQATYDQRKVYVREMLESYPDVVWEDELVVNLDALT
ncbi:MAG: phosphomannomutase/phosphoglucomutase [Verrucomicrobia bacterium]|nr:phosphomannomutase/phosphoglucomutase [Verrucomicrobiota bacterium]MDA1086512.1 phosphomannomutase/phosphoglucomutase [Verrucomicrobiota bacterium]